jgi:hypothetical protein
MRRRGIVGFGFGTLIVAVLVVTAAGCGGSKKTPTTTAASPPPYRGLDKASAAQAMAGVFSRPSTGPVPSGVAAAVSRVAKTAFVGRLLVHRGRLLLSNLGPKRHAIYVFPTTKGQVCLDITRLVEGCKPAFIFGEPASMDGGNLHFPPTSGPPAELAGLTKDAVRRVQVVLKGTRHDAIFGHDAWYYRFPNSRIPATAATKLIVTLSDGSTKTVPTQISKPRP